MKALLFAVLVSFSTSSVFALFGSQEIPYYGEDFYKSLGSNVPSEELVAKLQKILQDYHRTTPGGFDEVASQCSGKGCYKHTPLGYDRARVFMMGVYYLVKDGDSYALPDVYCGVLKTAKDFESNPPAPNQIPLGSVLNTEHTWPQSKFTGSFDKETQKSDLHHLYPTDAQVNSIRGNNKFGEVVKDTKVLKCRASRTGKPAEGNEEVFEPPNEHKGNVARALFYFAIRYKMRIGGAQEVTLRRWNKEDPVDSEEFRRNGEIQKIQGNRNPFVDYPDLVDSIRAF